MGPVCEIPTSNVRATLWAQTYQKPLVVKTNGKTLPVISFKWAPCLNFNVHKQQYDTSDNHNKFEQSFILT